jgi:hypothetical protein
MRTFQQRALVVPGLVQCTCGGELCRRSSTGSELAYTKRYRCLKCRRYVPWCFGAADDKPELCDDCWAEAHPVYKQALRARLAQP